MSNIPPVVPYTDIRACPEKSVILTGHVHTIRLKPRVGFLILRQSLETIQCVITKENPHFNLLSTLSNESFVRVKGTPVLANVKQCSIINMELQIEEIKIISLACELPIGVKEASATQKESANTPPIAISKLLDNRVLHMRTFQCQAIFKVLSHAMHCFRDFLIADNQFIEIKTSKLIESSSEGGANVFEVKFFDKKAFLAQSPQLYKQMAIIGGFERVFEIGHVYRAEEQNTNRYLSEFVGVDIEMRIEEGFEEVIGKVYEMLTGVFTRLNQRCESEINVIRAFRDFKSLRFGEMPLIIEYSECVEMLKKKGIAVTGDFNRESEKILGEMVAQEHEVDIFVITKYPTAVRAFYTKPIDDNSGLSYSFDFIMRGEEVLSGAERISTYGDLIESIKRCGIPEETVKGYTDSFKYGVPRHGGCGIGFERLMKTFFDFDDIRYFNMFPRDAGRLFP